MLQFQVWYREFLNVHPFITASKDSRVAIKGMIPGQVKRCNNFEKRNHTVFYFSTRLECRVFPFYGRSIFKEYEYII